MLEEKKECIRQREWVYYPESFEPLAMLEGQELYIYHNDPNGCPTRLLDTDGNVVWAARYDALGKVERIAVNQVNNPIRMQGQYFDSETGLYYNRYRYFDPMIGAFVSQDPLGLMAGENLYAFAPNVLGWIDPLGLARKCVGISKKRAGKGYKDGEFSITNWDGYPKNGPKPKGPFRLLKGKEYEEARTAANKANQAIHKADPSLKGKQIHEVKPVKFGGSPTDKANKIPLTPKEHAQYTKYWNNLQKNIEGKG